MEKTILALCIILFWGCNSDNDNPGSAANPKGNNPLRGNSYLMEFFQADPSAPYQPDQVVGFEIKTNGDLRIDVDPDAMNGFESELASAGKVGDEYSWEDNSGGYRYLLSLKDSLKINEINLFSLGTNDFLGQFTEVDTSSVDPLELIKALAGTYNISNVLQGSHNRMTVIIDPDGNIDFDSSVQLDNSTYELISDQRECCDGIWIDMTPYPTTTYPRIELYFDTQGDLKSMTYYPQYSSVSGRVEVEF